MNSDEVPPAAPLSLRALDLLVRIVLGGAMVLSAGFIVLAVFVLVFDTSSISVDGTSLLPVSLDESETNASSNVRFGRANVSVELEHKTGQAIAFTAVAAALSLGVTALWNLWLVVESAKDGNPFVRANVTRLTRAGRVVIAAPILFVAFRLALTAHLNDVEPLTLRIENPFGSFWILIIGGLALLSIAKVFERGVELQELDASTI